jgi:hypothetical protein
MGIALLLGITYVGGGDPVDRSKPGSALRELRAENPSETFQPAHQLSLLREIPGITPKQKDQQPPQMPRGSGRSDASGIRESVVPVRSVDDGRRHVIELMSRVFCRIIGTADGRCWGG